MNELLDEIVKIDNEAQSVLNDAVKSAADIEKTIGFEQKQIVESIMLATKEQLKQIENSEQEKLNEKIESLKKTHESAILAINKTFDENCEIWTKQIVSKVLS